MKAFLTKNLEPLLISTLAVFAPIKGIIIVTALTIIVDFITGIMAAKKRGEKITSAKMSTTISKLFIAETAILMGFLIQTYLLGDSFPLCNVVAGIYGIKEGKSLFENLNTISGSNLFQSILSLLSSPNNSDTEKTHQIEEKHDEDKPQS